MSPRKAAFLANAATASSAVSFFLASIGAWPVPHYLPVERHWRFLTDADAQKLSTVTMDYFGRTSYAVVVGLVVLAFAYLVVRKKDDSSPPITDLTLWLSLAYAATAVLLSASLFAYKLHGREPVLADPGPNLDAGEVGSMCDPVSKKSSDR